MKKGDRLRVTLQQDNNAKTARFQVNSGSVLHEHAPMLGNDCYSGFLT